MFHGAHGSFFNIFLASVKKHSTKIHRNKWKCCKTQSMNNKLSCRPQTVSTTSQEHISPIFPLNPISYPNICVSLPSSPELQRQKDLIVSSCFSHCPPPLRSTVAPPGVAAGAPCHPPVCPSTRPLKLTEAKASIWGHTIRDISPSSSPAVPAALATSAILNDPLSSSCSLSLVYSCT